LPRWVDEGTASGRADDMKLSHVFISRPRREAEELAAMLAPLGLQTVVQPAFD